jgi:hypothetical protein
MGTIEDAGMGGWLDKISGWFGESFVPGLLNVWDRVAQFIEDIKNGERLQTAVRKMLQGLFSEDTVQKAVDIVSFARGISTAIHNGDWSTVGTMLWGVVQSAFSRAIAAGQTIDEMLRDWISGKLGIKAELKLDPGMEGLPSDVIAGMMPNTSTWAEIGVELKNRLIEQFNVAKDRVGEWLAVGGNFAAKLFESIKLGIMDALTIAPLFERNEMGEWVDKSPWKSIGDAIGAKIGNAITTGLRAWFDFTFYGIPETIHDWVTANIEKFRSAGESIGTALASMISSGLQKAVSPTEHKEWGETIMHDIIVALTSAAASLSMDIGNIGLAIADGIAAGLTSRIDSEAWRAGLSEGLYQAIKVALETGPLGWIIRLAGGWDALQKLRDSPQGQAIDRALPFGSKASGGAASGLTLVGERGPELVNLPVGSYVHDNAESQRMMANHTYNVSVTITGNANAKDVEVGVLRGLRAAGVAV